MALETYLKRGFEAISLLDKEQFDGAMEKLRLRDAAYHNFRALDHLALESGIDIARDGDVANLWLQVESLNKDLMYRLLSHLNISAGQLRQVQVFRKDMQNYASGNTPSNKFLKIV